MLSTDKLDKHFRLSKIHTAALKRLKIETAYDLLTHFPTRYDEISEAGHANALVPGAQVILYGQFTKLEAKKLWKSRRPAAEGRFEDASGKVKVLWFNQPYMANMTPLNMPVKISGTVAGTEKDPYITNPEVSSIAELPISEDLFQDNTGVSGAQSDIFPVYPETKGITSKWIYHALQKILSSGVLDILEDPIPSNVCKAYKLPNLKDALIWIHTPKKKTHKEAARKRFAFEEIFTLQTMKQMERAQNEGEMSHEIDADKKRVKEFVKTFPYKLTGAQARAVDEILSDFSKPHPMARLLEGDVGSGKTAVAAATAYAAVTSTPPLKLASGEFGRLPDGSIARRKSGTLQVAYMAPTEILAGQHFQSFIEHFKELPLNIGLITGSGCFKYPSKMDREKPTKISRSQFLKWVANGEIAIVIGTHALIQKSVEFQDLAYVIVDEQHRFGTAQRKALAKKQSSAPHFLSMTATPIPRTLALTIYGDLDISVLDELPPGRASVTTKVVTKGRRASAHERLREELVAGHQGYVICPRIDEPDPDKAFALRVKSAKEEAKKIAAEFSKYEVGLLHGKLTPSEKETTMKKFADGEIHILVATSVVEVGINVPNATVILIEGAERFGLAQLHQLRGRVLRSHHPAHCFLLPEKLGAPARERLGVLAKTTDGFQLAEADLNQRGMGDLYGRKQWGISDIGMEALKNPRLIEAARKEAEKIVKNNPGLKKHVALRKRIESQTENLHEE